MPKISWQTQWDEKEPKTQHEVDQERVRVLRWELDVDHDIHYTLEELEEMEKEYNESKQR